MAYGRVNVGGSSGLKINKIEKINDKLTKNEISKIVTLSQSFDINKSIALIEVYSKDDLLNTVSLIANLTSSTGLLVSRNTNTGSLYDTEFTLTIIEFDGLKSLNVGELRVEEDIVYQPLKNVTNIDNCLIFSSQKGSIPSSYPASYLIEKKIVMYNGSPHLRLRNSATSKPQAQYIHYYVIEI